MVSELAGEGAVPPQLPTPASHAELRVRQSIRRGSLLRLGAVNLKVFRYFIPLVRAVESVNHQRWLRFFPSISSSSSWSRSAKCSSKVLVNRTSWSRSMKRLGTVLVNSLFTIFVRSRSAKTSSAELVVVVSSPQRRTRKKKVNPLFLAFNCSSRNRSVECTSTAFVVDSVCVGRLPTILNQNSAMDSRSRSVDFVCVSRSRRGEQPVFDSDFGCVYCNLDLSDQQLEAEPVKEEPENPSATSIKLKKTKEPKAKKSSAPKKRNPPAHPPYSEKVQEAIVTLKERTGSSQYAIQKFIAKKQRSNFRKLLPPMMTLWIVRYDFQYVLHIVCVDRVLTIDKDNAQHKIAFGLLCSNNSADKCVVVEFVSVEFIDVWEHVSEKIWIEAFCKSCWKWMHVNYIEANVLRLFFRSAVGHIKESGLSEELFQLLKFMESRLQLSFGRISLMEELCRLVSQLDLKADFSEFLQLVLSRLAIGDLAEYCDGILSTASSVWFLDTSIEEQQRFDHIICLISSSVDEVLSQGSLAVDSGNPAVEEFQQSHLFGVMQGIVFVWSLTTGEKIQEPKGHKLQVADIELDSFDFVSTSIDYTLGQWRKGKQIEY